MSVALDPTAAVPPPAGGQDDPLLNLAVVDTTEASADPYQHILIDNLLSPGVAERLEADYPTIDVSGYIAMEPEKLPPVFRDLVEELKGPALTEALSKAFGRDLHPYPRLVTMRRWSTAHEGDIHTDSERKIMTMLLYLNPGWISGASGSLRVLYDGKNFEPYALEVPPLNGTAFAFMRSHNSWHGHLPFTGERRVIQVTWLRDAGALDRKMSSNALQLKLKRFFSGKKASKPMM